MFKGSDRNSALNVPSSKLPESEKQRLDLVLEMHFRVASRHTREVKVIRQGLRIILVY